eukprot:gb/GECG01013275.1/.p1 GENE.gb/GECG01013275.1/~~gb/GECG01013275.1/.p1  ORF type:complete len:697 (+),score=95.10 gb/GECG01013275.1/:1-2091(+)
MSAPKRAKTMNDTIVNEDKTTANCVNTIRVLAGDITTNAKSGHPGAPMGCAPIAHVLWGHVMKYNPKNPQWFNRDRFVLSNGHACALQYTMLHLTGYDMPMEQLKKFRKLGSITAGHPENELHPAIEVSTGPLGQGISNSVGMALAEKHLEAEFNSDDMKLIDNHIFTICSDGDLQEGVSSEASSLAGHLGLGKLIALYDDNQISIDGKTELSFSEDVLKRYEAYGWHVQRVTDGNRDLKGIAQAIENAKNVTDKPSMIAIKTYIGFGTTKENTADVHGSPLDEEALRQLKTKFGFNPDESFVIPEEVAKFYKSAGDKGAAREQEWNDLFQRYAKAYPEKAKELQRRIRGELPEGWEKCLPAFSTSDKDEATRSTSGKVLNALAEKVPELIGGSADLTPSNKTELKCSGNFSKESPIGRYLRFGVREHGMTAIGNGIFAYGALRPFVATFLNFIGYAAGSTRLSAISGFGLIFVATHDSIGLGEDGPTHQPIEMLSMLRAMPKMTVFRPADGNEVAAAYELAIRDAHHPSVLALSRQNLPHLDSSREKAKHGGYQVFDTAGVGSGGKPDIVIVSTGSEVSIAIDGAKQLSENGKRACVVSLLSWEVFEQQDREYRKSVLPEGVPTLAVEALASTGWGKFSHAQHCLDQYGVSAPYKDAYTHFGFTGDNVKNKGLRLIQYFDAVGHVPALPIHMPAI